MSQRAICMWVELNVVAGSSNLKILLTQVTLQHHGTNLQNPKKRCLIYSDAVSLVDKLIVGTISWYFEETFTS